MILSPLVTCKHFIFSCAGAWTLLDQQQQQLQQQDHQKCYHIGAVRAPVLRAYGVPIIRYFPSAVCGISTV